MRASILFNMATLFMYGKRSRSIFKKSSAVFRAVNTALELHHIFGGLENVLPPCSFSLFVLYLAAFHSSFFTLQRVLAASTLQ